MKKYQSVNITITDADGVVLDQFPVSHWRGEIEDENLECVGSPFADTSLIDRIEQYVEEPPYKTTAGAIK